jgi:hypothetical protein
MRGPNRSIADGTAFMSRRAVLGLAFALAGALSAIAAGPAAAREYPWCAMIPMFQAGPAQLCQFDTLEQCRAEILGHGGWCNLNPYYREPVRGGYREPRSRERERR